jgi:DNA-binding NarL/FixJ family response regulator
MIEDQQEVSCPRIVIADDDTCFIEMLEIALGKAGMDIVATATNGKHAIESTIEKKPDCLLLDIAMPRMDGFAALANIKFLLPEVRVIVVSALKDPNCRLRAMELGANAFFLKGECLVEKLTAIINALAADESCSARMKGSPNPIFPSTPQLKLRLEDQELSSL